ncbi:hypothetical protein MCOR07_006622 [Pyricularia oryzae]|nr:hypothetical protein MCOR06_003449 [Pyricularia oryzae]KAI6618310.1 hypothetical protein MCOR07_006622 [Pyricularia oryzae]
MDTPAKRTATHIDEDQETPRSPRRIAALDILKNEPTQSRISVQKKKGGGIYGKVIFAHQVLFHEKA